MKRIKNFEYEGPGSLRKKQIVEKHISTQIVTEEVASKLKDLLLLREKDRTLRENSIKVLKKLINFNPSVCKIYLALKFEVFISFILEREYKHAQVLKERTQCYKFIVAWLKNDPNTFPYLLGQTISTIAKNPEDAQLRKEGIEAIVLMCQYKP